MGSETPYTSEVSQVDASDYHFGFGAVQASTIFDSVAKVEDRFFVSAPGSGVLNDGPAIYWTLTGSQALKLDSMAGGMVSGAGIRMDAKIRINVLNTQLLRVGFFKDGEDPSGTTPKGVYMEKDAASGDCYLKAKDDVSNWASATAITWLDGRDVDVSVSVVMDGTGKAKATLNLAGQTLTQYFDSADFDAMQLSFQIGVKNAGAPTIAWTFVRSEGQ